jgi:FkbM family methyltransferase
LNIAYGFRRIGAHVARDVALCGTISDFNLHSIDRRDHRFRRPRSFANPGADGRIGGRSLIGGRHCMGLSFDDRLKQFIPAWLYYPQRIAKCALFGEPELRILGDLVPSGCRALDIGANRGYYSYALSKIAGPVEAFEPHPDLARFIRRKLGRRVHVHEVALSNHSGSAMLRIPQVKPGIDVHYNSSIKHVYAFEKYIELPVRVMTLDEFGYDDVGFIKIDVEGSDMDTIEGGRLTIARNRPNMVVEITAHTHAEPLTCIEQIKRTFGYDARIMVGERLIDALKILRDTPVPDHTCNVVFTPK